MLETFIDSLEFDLTRVDSDVGTVTTQGEHSEDSESDTESNLLRRDASVSASPSRGDGKQMMVLMVVALRHNGKPVPQSLQPGTRVSGGCI